MRLSSFVLGTMIAFTVVPLAGHAQAQAAEQAVKSVSIGNKICPVSGEKVNSMTPVTYEYEGKIYHFCCPGCIAEFKKDPQKYIKKVEEELKAAGQNEKSKQGVTGMDMGNHEGHDH